MFMTFRKKDSYYYHGNTLSFRCKWTSIRSWSIFYKVV